jgi:hypothetical protein
LLFHIDGSTKSVAALVVVTPPLAHTVSVPVKSATVNDLMCDTAMLHTVPDWKMNSGRRKALEFVPWIAEIATLLGTAAV